jgi:spermidine/putrescine-binding protein
MVKRIICFLSIFVVSCSAGSDRVLNLFIWSSYVSPAVWKRFEDRTGIRINYDTYDSNQVLLEKLRAGVVQYDIVCPTNWLVKSLRELKLVERLDHSKLPNLKNISDQFRNPTYDPMNSYSVPFVWGTSGIGYNKKKVDEAVDSWSILWNPKYAGRILMLDGAGDCFIAALRSLGYSMNSSAPQELKEAADLLMKQKPLVKIYNSSNFDEYLLSGDVWIAFGWSGQLARASELNPDIAYIVPKEGSMVWMDTLAIPVSAHHKNEAYRFIDFLLDPENAAQITNETGYASANEAAKSLIEPRILRNAARYPDAETLARCEWSIDQPKVDAIKDRYWTEIKLQ